jgi:predicted GH43/DUF377 family glycosyl hydrolase/glycosyltransferase involved in cell wall biosynthesis
VSKPTIALAMIVRNEEAIIERCLESVRSLIDYWVICDTGSSDATVALVNAGLEGVPGQLHHAQWVDFGHNRTELMGHAREAADYLLLIDADMTVRQRGPLGELSADAYVLREAGPLDFGVIRLVRGARRWWFEGSTHEHIETDGRFTQELLPALAIEHHADGASRWTKLTRDAGLLKRDLARNPRNARAVFYLAQTYRDLGRLQAAIAHYARRVAMGGWDEEVFYARLQEGVLRARLGDETAIAVLLDAWERRPWRAEPLYELARIHRERGSFVAAQMFATRGLELAYPDDVLFIHRWVYDWGLLLERGIAAAGLGLFDDARADLREVSSRPRLPPEIGDYAAARLAQLDAARVPAGHREASKPARLETLAPGVRIGEIRLDARPAWPAFNPSVAPDGDGFRMIVRTANYAIERGVLHADGVLHNINYLLALDAQLAVEHIAPIVDVSSGLVRHPAEIQGYEDCRLFQLGGAWYATATVCDLNPLERREIALLRFDGPKIAAVLPLIGPHPSRHEKNWMPFVRNGELLLLYRASPTLVLRCDPETGGLERIAESDAPAAADELRGGSQGVAVDDDYLFVVHEVDHRAPAMRYLHRLIMLDRELSISAISPPFTFTSDRVEFCAGMARRGDELVLSFGVSDAAAGLALLPLSDALNLLV